MLYVLWQLGYPFRLLIPIFKSFVNNDCNWIKHRGFDDRMSSTRFQCIGVENNVKSNFPYYITIVIKRVYDPSSSYHRDNRRPRKLLAIL